MKKTIRDQLTRIFGPDGVSFEKEECITYAYDATNRSYLPDAVAFPSNAGNIADLMRLANRERIPVIPRGAGTGLTGGALAVHGGVVLAMNRLDRIIKIDLHNLIAVVEPGVVTGKLQDRVAAHGLFYPPDPASFQSCTIGGNIAENAGGMRAVKYGVTRNYVMGLEVVLPSGEIIDTGSGCIKDVVGYDLTSLFVGAEGTLGIITRAILRLLPLPEARQTLMCLFPSVEQAARTVPDIIRARIVPATLEFMDRHCIQAVDHYLQSGFPAEAMAFLLIEIDGFEAELPAQAKKIKDICARNGSMDIRIAADATARDRLWEIRRSITAAMTHLPIRGDGEDIVVPRSRIPEIIRRMDAIAECYGLYTVNFGHAGDGNLHVSLAEKGGPVSDKAAERARAEILAAVVEIEGRIAGEHGIGLLKNEKIPLNLSQPTIELMRQIKQVLDPLSVLNPGKIFPSRR